MRPLCFAILSLLVAAESGAQIIRGGRLGLAEPAAWVSGGVALTQSFDIRDGSTSTSWAFGDATQYSASLERALSGGPTIGVRGTHARVPVRYASQDALLNADANVSQLLATVHLASGRSFHSVFELSAGATIFSNFRDRDSESRLPPSSPDADFSFVFGYGVGYNFSPTFAVDVVQDLTTNRHQSTGLNAGDNTTARILTTRLVARYGLGSRR